MLTRAEKEKRVIELYEQGATYRTIAKEVHMSLREISIIIRRHKGEVEPEKEEQRQQNEQTIDTKVFELLEDGRTPVEVAISMNLKSDEVTRLCKEWWDLKGLQQLKELHVEIGDDIFQLHRTFKFIKDKGYDPGQLIDARNHLEELPLLRSKREQLMQENQKLEEQKQNKIIELEELKENIAITQQNLDYINASIQGNNEDLERLNREKLQVQTFIASMNTSTGFQNMQRIAETSARSILTQNKVVLVAALQAILQALKEEPRNQLQFLIYGFLSYPLYEPRYGNRPKNYVQLRQELLLDSAEEVYTNLLNKTVNNTISTALDIQSGFRYPHNRSWQ